ncbi:hypothetical protein ADIAL_1711 [Alkalibacterium sp. AK22]|uniref:cell division protein FtsL n=1 Tax=Alkalibacterium sp. AK22 TaxID=1229520 RepID=UPI00044BB337|nr:cell division protein FtsL [Alkalibacterium sp. AK22]EXJ22860.1 hypothetical protein ADIAL_1711 [Alkalibacterium sp. AK22]
MMNDNLARQISSQQPLDQPQIQQEPQKVHRPTPKPKGLTRLEGAVISLFGMVAFVLAVGHIALSMQVSTLNRSIQDLESQAVITQVQNENFEQEVQELSRYDRVYSIAREHGLEMNEEQIRNVFR